MWRCVDGAIRWRTRIADPLPAGCAPFGTWALTAGEPTVVSSFDDCLIGFEMAVPATVQLEADIDGGLLFRMPQPQSVAHFDASACRLDTRDELFYENDWSQGSTMSLAFDGSTASGDYTNFNHFGCGGLAKGSLTASRQP